MARWRSVLALAISVAAMLAVFTGSSLADAPGQIAGTVSDPSGAPLAGVSVDVYTTVYGVFVASTSTDASGRYTVPGVPAGAYAMLFGSSNAELVYRWYNDEQSLFWADAVAVTAGATTGGIDTTLGPPGTISGRVTDPAGNPLSDVAAMAPGGTAVTDADGRYTITGLAAGDYVVQFGDADPADGRNLVPTDYSQVTGTVPYVVKVHVTAGGTTTGIDAEMEFGGSISGTVTDTAGNPLAGVGVGLDGLGENATTDAAGHYTLTNLEPGIYPVWFQPPAGADYLHQNFGGTPVPRAAGDSLPYPTSGYTPVEVDAGATTTGIDGELETGGVISGTVIDEAGRPLAGISVNIATPASGPAFEWPVEAGAVKTEADGTYRIDRLAAGTYRVSFSGDGYDGQLYGDTQDYDAATPVAVPASTTITGIDARMRISGEITGTVSGLQGGLLGAIVTAYHLDGTVAGMTATSTGAYTLANLPAGEYLVAFSGFGVPGASFYSDTPDGTASVVTVTSGRATSGIDGRPPSPTPTVVAATAAAAAAASSSRLDGFHGTLGVSPTGRVTIRLRCTGPAACRGAASLSVTPTGRRVARRRAAAGAITIGTAKFRVAAGRTASVQMRVTTAGRVLLRRGGGRVTSRLTIAGPSGAATQQVVARLRASA
jgi:protocatechuate 3,4-dioxygenase beta subunit